MVVTISYFFKSAKQKAEFLNSNSFLMEGYLALKSPTNVYGFLCKAEKFNNEWCFAEIYANRPTKKTSIDRLAH